ncbi:MAG: hypothetical protein LBV54_06875 [Puniceicoccales bacterium]|jgi:hypothetical protein|nr:hypothetical protein [Puniceicoccales bacterium]
MQLLSPFTGNWRLFALLSITGWLGTLATAPAQERNVFGETASSEAAFVGIFYDFKQNQTGEPTNIDVNRYWNVIDEFISKGWDESVLNRYYRASRTLYTTQIFVPYMGADRAPAAFGVGATIKESRWVIHYKAQVSPPTNGRYRFWGASDDFIAVALDTKNVLVKPFHLNSAHTLPKTNWVRTKTTNPEGINAASDRLLAGDWMDLRADQIYDLDILMGERPGGQFFAFLMCEKEGDKYEQDADAPILPIFQIAHYDTPVPQNGAPKFAKQGPVWKSHQ